MEHTIECHTVHMYIQGCTHHVVLYCTFMYTDVHTILICNILHVTLYEFEEIHASKFLLFAFFM